LILTTPAHSYRLFKFSNAAALAVPANIKPRMQAFVCGRAASGLSCILVRVISKATLPDSPAGLRQSTLLFLGFASIVVAACSVVAAWLPAEAPTGEVR
jgi:hypothetical protein